MRLRALTGARSVLLAGPVVLAFFSGGYFDTPRAWAGLGAWALVAIAALVAVRPLPRARPARVALLGLCLLAAWTLLSLTWAPLAGSAYHYAQRVFVYAGALLAASMLLRGRSGRMVEPAAAGGALVVVGYGLSERLLPWLLTFHHSLSAQGRLEQPLTYWNAMGALAALGVVLCARIGGDERRPDWLRAGAVAGAAPLGLGLYCSFSRGALFACAAGLIALLVLAPTRASWQGLAVAAGAAVAGAICGAPFPAVTSLASHQRVLVGTLALALLVVVALVAALLARKFARSQRRDGHRDVAVALPRRAGTLALVVVVACFGLFLIAGSSEKSLSPSSAGATRLTSLQSNRYDYWGVAWRAFRAEPLHGVGAGGWAVYWRRYRPVPGGAQDAHSLYIQTAAELGIVGLALLAMFFGGVTLAARRAHRFAPLLAAGPIAGLVVFATHAAVDWDWEMPAVTLPSILLAGALLALSDFAPMTTPAPAQP